MAEEPQEKDMFWIYIGGGIALVIVLVFMMKGREEESIMKDAYAEQQIELKAQQTKESAGTTYGE